jgi:hypothetical protein
MHKTKTGAKRLRLLGMDTCPSLNDIMEIRCNKCTRSEPGRDTYTTGSSRLDPGFYGVRVVHICVF